MEVHVAANGEADQEFQAQQNGPDQKYPFGALPLLRRKNKQQPTDDGEYRGNK